MPPERTKCVYVQTKLQFLFLDGVLSSLRKRCDYLVVLKFLKLHLKGKSNLWLCFTSNANVRFYKRQQHLEIQQKTNKQECRLSQVTGRTLLQAHYRQRDTTISKKVNMLYLFNRANALGSSTH